MKVKMKEKRNEENNFQSLMDKVYPKMFMISLTFQ